MKKDNLIWIDLEMSGLNPEKHVILEIGSTVTNSRLDIIAEGPDMAISYPEHTLSSMDEWSQKQHQTSGLLDRVKASSYTCELAEQHTLDFISEHCREGESPLCGNSVWQDRRFLVKYMPRLNAFFHYRDIDVSSVKELVTRWYPSLHTFNKNKLHLSISDIRESINELRYYRENVFLKGPKGN